MIRNQPGRCAVLRTHRLQLLSTAAIMVLLLGPNLFGSSINYGTFEGSTVTFLSVTENSTTDDTALFGAPIATTNSLAFSPTEFGSASQGGTSDHTDGQLAMKIKANSPDNGISFIVLSELGDYTLQGQEGSEASATVGAHLIWTIVAVDGEDLAGPLPDGSANVQFNGSGENGGEFSLPGDRGTARGWSGQYVLDLDGFLLDEGINGSATEVQFTFNNTLTTSSDESSTAFIKKKQAQQITVTAVPQMLPEPTAGMMVLPVVLAGLALRRRRTIRSRS